MNTIFFVIFLIILSTFVFFMFAIKKISISVIFRYYFRNYYSNAIQENERKFNVFYLIFLGIVPYALGTLLFLSFQDFLIEIDIDLMLQIDIIFLTIFCLFIGLDFNKGGKEPVKNELVATLLINVLLIVVSVFILLLAGSLEIIDETPSYVLVTKKIFFAIYYALNFKIFVMFFYSLKRMFILTSK